MKRLIALVMAASAAVGPAPAAAQGAGAFSVVNQTGLNMTDLTIRRYGTQGWRALGSAPSPGGRAGVNFKDPDCAFDIQATLQGVGAVVWSGVNLCGEVKAVILNRNASGALWVDYE